MIGRNLQQLDIVPMDVPDLGLTEAARGWRAYRLAVRPEGVVWADYLGGTLPGRHLDAEPPETSSEHAIWKFDARRIARCSDSRDRSRPRTRGDSSRVAPSLFGERNLPHSSLGDGNKDLIALQWTGATVSADQPPDGEARQEPGGKGLTPLPRPY